MKGEPTTLGDDLVDFSSLKMTERKNSIVGLLQCEMSCKNNQKDCGKKVLKTVLNKLRLKKVGSATISKPDPLYKVSYLGNVVTGWAKGEGCVEKPLSTLWRNYTQSSRPDVAMQLSVSGGGLKATTKDHGLTEYWANRLTFCASPSHFPRIFCWVYRHEGRKLKHELRCHAVLCSSANVARQIDERLKHSLALALAEFKKDKILRQNARLSLINCLYEYPTIPRRKILLSNGSINYKLPLERSKSAPKLSIIEENVEERDEVGEYKLRREFVETMGKKSRDCVVVVAKKEERIKEEQEEEEEEEEEKEPCDARAANSNFEKSDDNNAAWYALNNNYNEPETDIILRKSVDSDEGSLSSGCETSSSSVVSDAESTHFSTIIEVEKDKITYSKDDCKNCSTKSELVDFKLGGCVSNFDQLTELTNLRKYCWLNNNNNGVSTTGGEQVSLVPLGECQNDFSSLKVFKRRHSDNSNLENGLYEIRINGDKDEDKTSDFCDEGYDEEAIDSNNSVTKLVLL